MKRQAGFTLVEIAIVLVVIGLLLGGVLKGQELILNSQIRNAVNEFNNVASAKFTYQDRYREIPGDDNTAIARWDPGAAGTVEQGNGDRSIQGDWNNTDTSASETGIFWHHLRNDGLVTGPRDATVTGSFELPRNAFDGLIGVQETAFQNAMSGLVICQSGVPGKAAAIIDARIDDDPGDGSGSDTGSLQGATTTSLKSEAAEGDYVLDDTQFSICREL